MIKGQTHLVQEETIDQNQDLKKEVRINPIVLLREKVVMILDLKVKTIEIPRIEAKKGLLDLRRVLRQKKILEKIVNFSINLSPNF